MAAHSNPTDHVTSSKSNTPNVSIDLSHQDTLSLVTRKLEDMWTLDDTQAAADAHWIPVSQVEAVLFKELGFEDADEFRDALHCSSFAGFLETLPHIELTDEDDRCYFRVKPTPAQHLWRACKLSLHITNTSDLLRIVSKSPAAWVEVPGLEFEICQDRRRCTDSIYNHIATASNNLGNYVKQQQAGGSSSTAGGGGLSSGQQAMVLETVQQLDELIQEQVHVPWTFVLHDPSGMSAIKPDEGVQVEYGPEPEEQQQQAEEGRLAAVPEEQTNQEQED